MKKILLLSLLISFLHVVHAQNLTGIVKGFVYEKANSEPIIGATVSLKDKNKGTQTNVNGFFNLSKIFVNSVKMAFISIIIKIIRITIIGSKCINYSIINPAIY